MNTYLIFMMSVLIVVLYCMTRMSIKRREPATVIAFMGGITGACIMFLLVLVATWY